MKSAILATALFAFAGTAHAATTINFGPVSSTDDGPTISFLGLATPTGIVGNATITISLSADINSGSEYVDITLDGFSLGRVFNDDESDDLFDFEDDDGAQKATETGSATIGNADFAALIADGELNLVFSFSNGVNFSSMPVEDLQGSITFQEVSAVPLPASALLLLGGVAGLGAAGRRKARKSA